jgi:hypothetical protein
VDERLVALDRAVAQAADAWLAAPVDWRVYARLVEAVEARRAYLQPQLENPPPPPPVVAPATQPDEVLDDLAEFNPAVPLGDLVAGDPQAVVARLRGGVE